MLKIPPARLWLKTTGVLLLGTWAWLLTACGPQVAPVTEPPPAWEAAGPALAAAPRMVTPRPWILYGQPSPRFGLPVLRASAGAIWDVTGRWQPAVEPGGNQWWVIAPYNTWYRLRAQIPPWGWVSVWGLLPDQWLADGTAADDIPWVDAPWGPVWTTVPYSVGHFLSATEEQPVPLHTCPHLECPLLYAAAGRVPVTGVWEQAGARWYRVDYQQALLWTPAQQPAQLSLRGWLRALNPPAAESVRSGWRSCEPLVLFPPPALAICAVTAQGRYVDEFERTYDKLDPVFGREASP